MKLFDDSGVLQVSSSSGGGTDSNAVHVNAASEINGISEKASPVSADLVIIEDSADSNNKKKVQVGNLPVGSVAAADVSVADSSDDFVGTDAEAVFSEIGETRHKNGFDLQDEDSNGTISWDDATRTFSIAVKSGESEYYYWIDGKKVTQTTTKSVIVPDTTGAYYIYFADDTGVLTATLESSLTSPVFYEYAIVGLVYWNKTQAKGMCGNERHGYRLSSSAHDKDHHTLGALYASGLDITGLSSGNKTYTQTDSGVFYDEDIKHTVTAETTHPFLYRLGATGEWTLLAASNEVAYKDGGDSYYSWNEWTGSTWQLTEGTNSTDYFMSFFIATPSIGSNNIMKIIGQNAYSSRSKARNAIESELSNLKTNGLPSPEFVFLYVIIAKRNGNLQTLADGSLYVDLRYVKGVGGGSSPASYAADILTDTSNFDNNLSTADTNVQLALETLDDMSSGGGSGFDWTTENDVTTDQTPATTDAGEMFRFTSATAADRSLTLPSVGSGEDGDFFWIANESSYVITVKTSDDDFIWNSGAGYGVEMLGGTIICVRYDHSATKWEITSKTGGMVRLEGLKLHLPCDILGTQDPGSTAGMMEDIVNKHRIRLLSGTSMGSAGSAKFGQSCAIFDGSSGYADSADSSDWDVFGSTSEDYTVACWVYFDNTASANEYCLAQYEDSNNQWGLLRKSDGTLWVFRYTGGVSDIDISGGTLSATTWYHIALCKIGSETGIYINGTQVAYDSSFTADAFLGSLYIGQAGYSSGYFDGRMDDIIIANQNIYDAAPNSTPDDTLSNWNKQFVGVQ